MQNENSKSNKIKNIKFKVMYDGSSYSGWQRVNNVKATKPSIQGVIEEGLSKILEEEITIISSGRTDAGVHAFGQVVNFKLNKDIDLTMLQFKMNELLPEDICIYEVEEVEKDFHSRYDAEKKTYEYFIDINERESVFNRKYAYPLGESLDIKLMEEGAKYLVGTHDFKAFCTDRKDGKSTIRTIYNIKIEKINERFGANEVKIQITGNGFLYNMVRIIVGTLIEVGLLKRNPENIKETLEKKERINAGITIGSQGLFLKNVEY